MSSTTQFRALRTFRPPTEGEGWSRYRPPGLGKTAALLAEARDLGLVEFSTAPTVWEDAVDLLRQVSDSHAHGCLGLQHSSQETDLRKRSALGELLRILQC